MDDFRQELEKLKASYEAQYKSLEQDCDESRQPKDAPAFGGKIPKAKTGGRIPPVCRRPETWLARLRHSQRFAEIERMIAEYKVLLVLYDNKTSRTSATFAEGSFSPQSWLAELTDLIVCAKLCCKLYRQSGCIYGEKPEGLIKWVREQLSAKESDHV